jgi:hypothetical protein
MAFQLSCTNHSKMLFLPLCWFRLVVSLYCRKYPSSAFEYAQLVSNGLFGSRPKSNPPDGLAFDRGPSLAHPYSK